MLACGYDWSNRYSKEQFECDLQVDFNGPGLYLTQTDTILVVPVTLKGETTPETIWNFDQPEGTIWEVFVWNRPFADTILAAPAAPNRFDTRER